MWPQQLTGGGCGRDVEVRLEWGVNSTLLQEENRVNAEAQTSGRLGGRLTSAARKKDCEVQSAQTVLAGWLLSWLAALKPPA